MGMRVSTIQQNIVSANLSENDLRALNATVVGLLRAQHANTIVKAAVQFRFGQLVQFRSKYGQLVKGKVLKINPKTIVVGVTAPGAVTPFTQKWTVTPTLLQAAV
jgi:ribosomal protein L35AE/L33A